MIYQSPNPFIYFRDSVFDKFNHSHFCHNDPRHPDRRLNITFSVWSNSQLHSGNSELGSAAIAWDCVEHAERMGTLHQIHNNMERLAFTIKMIETKKDGIDRFLNSFEPERSCSFTCYDLSTIKLRAARYRNPATPGPGMSNLGPNATYQVSAGFNPGVSNLSPIQHNISTYGVDEFRFEFEVNYRRTRKWRTNYWSYQMEQIWEFFSEAVSPQQHVLPLSPSMP